MAQGECDGLWRGAALNSRSGGGAGRRVFSPALLQRAALHVKGRLRCFAPLHILPHLCKGCEELCVRRGQLVARHARVPRQHRLVPHHSAAVNLKWAPVPTTRPTLQGCVQGACAMRQLLRRAAACRALTGQAITARVGTCVHTCSCAIAQVPEQVQRVQQAKPHDGQTRCPRRHAVPF